MKSWPSFFVQAGRAGPPGPSRCLSASATPPRRARRGRPTIRTTRVLLLFACAAAACAATPGVKLEASRLAGPAPLAVLFDASGTTAPGVEFPFHQLLYEFHFGDERGETWPHSGRPKNTQRGGPLAAHVFDRPGTYTVRVAVRAAGGGSLGEATLRVEVQDPDKVFAGSRTVCVSARGDFAGAPSGALRLRELPAEFSGKRILLRRGETFGRIEPRPTDSGFQIGAFGPGAKPVAGPFHIGHRRGVAEWAHDFTVMDLDLLGGVSIEATTSRALFYRNDLKTGPFSVAVFNLGTAVTYYHDHEPLALRRVLPWPREVFVVDNDLRGKVDAAGEPNVVLMGWLFRSALLGNTMDRATEHTLRVWAAGDAVIAHNHLGGNHHAPRPPGIRHAIKLHSDGTDEITPLVATSRRPRSSRVVVADNLIGSPTYPGSFLTGFAPQNGDRGTVEAVEDCIVENNVFVRGPHTISEVQLRGRRLSARGNTLRGGGRPDTVRSGARFDPALDAWDGPYFIAR